MRHGSLFSGIGGFDLAAEWMGWENVFHCEWMEFPRKVLEYHFPNADSLIDICKTDFKKYANKIDILTGGFPCQPFSMAGKRKGTDDERYLWGEMLRAVQEIKPQFVIAENVFGITNIDGGMVFEQVCLDLENQGYEVQPFIIPAAAKNAPHRRDRCWFIAQNTMFSGCLHGESEQERAEVWQQRNTCTRSSERIHLSEGNATNTNTARLHKQYFSAKSIKERSCCRSFNETRHFTRFPVESPICSGDDGISLKLDGITFSNWRTQSIKAYGNAIVPQVAYEIFKQIQPTANCD
jgi:DNA (cytosine-5)-methyltransferase 1